MTEPITTLDVAPFGDNCAVCGHVIWPEDTYKVVAWKFTKPGEIGGIAYSGAVAERKALEGYEIRRITIIRHRHKGEEDYG